MTKQEQIYAEYGRHNAAECWAHNYESALYWHAMLSERGACERCTSALKDAIESMDFWSEKHAEWESRLGCGEHAN